MERSSSGWTLEGGGKVCAIAPALFAGLLFAAGAGAEISHARVSLDGGGGLVKGIGEEDWSTLTLNSLILAGDEIWVDDRGAIEVEMLGGTFLRLADASHAEVASLPRSASIRGWVGSFYVQRLRFSSGQVVFETPACQVVVERLSQVRIDVLDDGETTVTVRQGRALIRVDGARDDLVLEGRRVYIDPGYLASVPERFDPDEEDAFDQWNRERSELVATASEAVPGGAGIKSEVLGAEDLSLYGDWVAAGSECYWRPRVAEDFVPYRDGYWSWVHGYGYVWVGQYPFSYITMHYGRWLYAQEDGWFWVYRDTWAPAWAATLRFGPTFAWCPLDPSGYPVVISNEYFEVGAVNFGVDATTCCAADDLLAGHCRPYACTPTLTEQFAVARAEIWRIFANNANRIAIAYNDPALRVRDYAPRRAVRGLDLSGSGRQSAPARAAALETRAPHATHSPETAAQRSSVKTPTVRESQSVRVRAVRIDASRLADTPKATSSAATSVVPDVQAQPRAGHPRVTRLGVRDEADASPKDDTPEEDAPKPVSHTERPTRDASRAIRSTNTESANPAREEPSPTPASAREQTPPQRIVESPPPVAEPRSEDLPKPMRQRSVDIPTPAQIIGRQAPEPAFEPVRAIRSSSESKPIAPAPVPVERPSPPPATPARTVEPPSPATPSPTSTVDSSRSIRDTHR